MARRLIINADDYGLTPGCDRVIERLMLERHVTSTSRLHGCQREPLVPHGVHLRLTDGEPALGYKVVPSLVDATGRFPRYELMTSLKLEDITLEFLQQIKSISDQRPTHLDSHHNVHTRADVFQSYATICRCHSVPGVPMNRWQAAKLREMGVPCADYAELRWTDGRLPTLTRLLAEDFERFEVVWLACHPGVADAELRQRSTMTNVREYEAGVLVSDAWKRWLSDNEVRLIGPDDLERPMHRHAQVDLIFLAWNRHEFSAESLRALAMNTNWRHVRKLIIYTDGDHGPLPPIQPEAVEYECQSLGGPVAIMNDYLSRGAPTPWFAKIDNDTIVPPGWLDECLNVLRGDPTVDLLGIEAIHPVGAGLRVAEPSSHIGGIGLMRTAAFTDLPSPTGRLGFGEWQNAHTEVTKAWLKPALPVFLLDRLPFDPWRGLSAEYERKGWQRPWERYTEADSKLWQWWLKA